MKQLSIIVLIFFCSTCLINGQLRCDGETCKLKVTGNVVLPEGVTSPLVSGSCLRMNIREEILCEECDVPELAAFRISNPIVGEGGKVAYQMTLSNPKEGARYIVSAVLNIGWCKEASSESWIKSGDYHTSTQVDFEAPAAGAPFKLDVPVEQYLVTAGNLKVTGNVVLPEGVTSPLVPGSCLRMNIREEILCEECDVPELAAFRISNPVVGEGGKVVYQMTLSNPKEGVRYIVSAVLNIGWCKEASSESWIKSGDYHTSTQVDFEAPAAGAPFKLDVPVEQYLVTADNKKKSTCERACPFSWEPLCGSDGKTYENECLLEVAHCKDDSVVLKAPGECRPPTVCEIKLSKAKNLPGEFIPQCNSDGTYRHKQCHSSTGFCWCVDPIFGTELFGSRKNVRDGSTIKCQKSCLKACARISKPVCANNGWTYGNICELENAQCEDNELKFQSEGKCPEAKPAIKVLKGVSNDDNCPGICTAQYEPHCGSDGKTYGNLCELLTKARCEYGALKLAYKGSCKECPPGQPLALCTFIPCAQKVCGGSPKAVCMNDPCGYCKNKWYLDGKEFKCEEEKCNQACPYIWDPKCGSDGKTYGNRCVFEVGQCEDRTLRLTADGACPTKTRCQKKLTAVRGLPGEYVPQCTSDGNYEKLQCHASTGHCWCVEQKTGREIGGTRKPAGQKVDCSMCVKPCQRIYKPVCGSDGRTYSNECEFENAKCKDQSLTIKNYFTCKKDDTEKPVPPPLYTVYGKLLFPPGVSTIPERSCVTVKAQEAIFCDYVPGVENSGCERVLDRQQFKPVLLGNDGTFKFKLRFGGQSMPVLLSATLNMGWCRDLIKKGGDWLRDGDYFTDSQFQVEIDAKVLQYRKDMNMKQYNKIQPQPNPQVSFARECKKRYDDLTRRLPKFSVGGYIPQCDEKGDYIKKQCHSGIGYCWCAETKSGKEIDGTRKNVRMSGFDSFECVQTCSERVSAASEGLTGGRPLLGAYNPQCDDKGDYKNKQCHGSTGYCWCVDTKSGKEIEGTRKNVRTTGANSFECGCTHNGKYYESGQSVWEECNSCTCMPGGGMACTLMACPPGVCYHKGQSFEDGQTYKDDCNTCTCSARNKNTVGISACTQMGCSVSCVKPCKRIYKPVCGSDARTYPNECEFENAKCKDQSLTIKNYFMCSDDIKKPELDEIVISGKVNFNPPVENNKFSKGSCIRVSIMEEIMCGTPPCNIPRLGKSFYPSPQLNQDGSYSYELRFKKTKPLARLLLEAYVNVGWCSEEGASKWIQPGDYLMELAHGLDIEKGRKEYKKDIEIELMKQTNKEEAKKKSGCIVDGVNHKTGSSFFKRCNRCKCLENGLAACTRKGCSKGVCYYEGKMKKDGETFLDNEKCNTCFCTAKDKNEIGHIGCTLKFCPKTKKLSFIHGNIILPQNAKVNLENSCLSVRIQEARYCMGCKPVIVESFIQKNVKMSKPGIIPYRMPFDGKPRLPYVVLATLNVGWCKQDPDWIRPGDYHSVTSSNFEGLEKEGGSIVVDVNLEGYKTDQREGQPLLTACQKEVTSAANGPLLLGRFTPKCEDDGSYKQIQCHGSTGFCWCVDEKGVKQAGTEKGPGKGKPECVKSDSECPKGVPLVACRSNPCDSSTCSAFPKARCQANFCGGCNAEFFVDDKKVDCASSLDPTNSCLRTCSFEYEPVCTSDGRTLDNKCFFEYEQCLDKSLTMKSVGQCDECPKDMPVVACYANPCATSTCPAFPKARCQANYCGGCNAEFFVDDKKVDCVIKSKRRSFDVNVAVAASVKEAAEECPTICNAIYAPLCGSDGQTHSNECQMKTKACTKATVIFKVHNGECGKCSKVCPLIYDAQCGTDGKNYGNECMMRQKTCQSGGKVTKAYAGECGSPSCPDNCEEVVPQDVCGSDGKTYGSPCHLQQKSCQTGSLVKFHHFGKCVKCSEICDRKYDPYCGTDDSTYGNECMMNSGICRSGGRVQIKYRGKCDKPSCPVKCPKQPHRVCASNGKTYLNLCRLQQATCGDRNIVLRHVGICADRCKLNRRCSFRFSPVCGADGKTYMNSCELRKAICISNGKIKRAYKGRCSRCPRSKPIVACAFNPCSTAFCPQFPRAQCIANFCGGCHAHFYLGGKRIQNCGTKCSAICTKELFPVCGSDGQTYSNKCTMSHATCKSGGVTIMVYEGPCKTTYY